MATTGGKMVDAFIEEVGNQSRDYVDKIFLRAVLEVVHGPSSECEQCEAALPPTALSAGGWDTLCPACERVLEPWRVEGV